MSSTFLMLKPSPVVFFKDQGSKFLSYGFPCGDQQSFENRLQQIKKEHYDATHHCYGWRIDPFELAEFAQDDGEPSGTAGLPILNQLRSAGLCNSAVVVVRYYGGTKLGKSGLINAYGSSARACIEEAPKTTIIPGRSLTVETPYDHKKQVDYLTETHQAQITAPIYTEMVTYQIHAPLPHYPALLEALQKLEYLNVYTTEGPDIIMES